MRYSTVQYSTVQHSTGMSKLLQVSSADESIQDLDVDRGTDRRSNEITEGRESKVGQ